MGFNEEFNNSKDQILLMDPPLTLNRAYSMILKVEKQRVTSMTSIEHIQMNAFMANIYGFVPKSTYKVKFGPLYKNKIYTSRNRGTFPERNSTIKNEDQVSQKKLLYCTVSTVE